MSEAPGGGERAEADRFLAEHAHYVEDLDFWLRTAAALPGPVLDLGAAAGRVAIPLARAGHAVWALDRSEAMLDALRRALAAESREVRDRVRPVLGDLTRLDLGVRFGLVICAMNTLQVLIEPEDQRACLEGVCAHLAAGGELVFDVILPDLGEIGAALGQLRHVGSSVDPDGRALIHWACYEHFDAISQTAELLTVIDEAAPGVPLERRVRRQRLHVYLPAELRHLLARSGLEVIEVLGDFDGTPIDAFAQRQIHRCRAVGARG